MSRTTSSAVPLLVLLTGGVALAGAIDLSKPYGNKDGCANRVQQEYYSEKMLLLTENRLVTAASACTFTGKAHNMDGSLTLTADCEVESEDGGQATTFLIKPSPKDVKRLAIADETGFVMGEVARCK